MDITGKIIAALEARGGVSQRTGTKWQSQDFVVEWMENQYPRHCVFTVFGEDRLKQMNLQIGQYYTVSLDVNAHEYNGRWFNDLRAWRAVPATAETPAAPAPAAAAPAPAAEVPAPDAPAPAPAADELPF